mmetsp:Transcript_117913/g.279850  ORF Transcript_117913/g.279850 Transcript_117913/m.279850 type:complete len:93 (+) Transcript_117913:593-871(+)
MILALVLDWPLCLVGPVAWLGFREAARPRRVLCLPAAPVPRRHQGVPIPALWLWGPAEPEDVTRFWRVAQIATAVAFQADWDSSDILQRTAT